MMLQPYDEGIVAEVFFGLIWTFTAVLFFHLDLNLTGYFSRNSENEQWLLFLIGLRVPHRLSDTLRSSDQLIFGTVKTKKSL